MQPPHLEVAERFRSFLSAVGLSRSEFAAAVDGAIEPQSLFSLMNGHRRPSRALAVLIERSWGFRADFLLDGTGEAWTKPAYASDHVGGAALSPDEAAVVDFLRASPQHAQDLEALLDQARAWDALLTRLQRLWDELEECAGSEDAQERSRLPLLAKLVLEDLRFAARQYEALSVLLHRQRVRRIADGLIERFFRQVPADLLSAEEALEVAERLRPGLERRREEARHAGLSLERIQRNIEEFCRLGGVAERVRERAGESSLAAKRELVARLAEHAPEPLREEAVAFVAELEQEDAPGVVFRRRLERVVRGLRLDEGTAGVLPDAFGPDALATRYDALLDRISPEGEGGPVS